MNDSAILHEHHTLSCIGDMAIGAFGAWCVSECSNFKLRIQKLKRFEIILIYILFLFVFLFRDEVMYSGFYIRIFERSILAVLALLIILEQNYAENSFFKLNNFKTITNLGTMTYGLYCLHFIGILVSIITRLCI
jgi:peptidoglycan/LPS O-acetylase OafA/YrhL